MQLISFKRCIKHCPKNILLTTPKFPSPNIDTSRSLDLGNSQGEHLGLVASIDNITSGLGCKILILNYCNSFFFLPKI